MVFHKSSGTDAASANKRPKEISICIKIRLWLRYAKQITISYLEKVKIPTWIGCILLMMSSEFIEAQKNYLNYYDNINKAELGFINNNLTDCYKYYNAAFGEYDRIFVKDAFIASQIAFAAGDTEQFFTFIKTAFDNGFPLTSFASAKILNGVTQNKTLNDRLQVLYKIRREPKIDETARDAVYGFFYREHIAKLSMGRDSLLIMAHQKIEKDFREYILVNFLKKGVFPSEQLIGIRMENDIDNYAVSKNLAPFSENNPLKGNTNNGLNFTTIPEEYDLWNSCAFVPFIHYPCSFKEFEKELWQCVLNGYVHPRDYAMISETNAFWNRDIPFSNYNCEYDINKPYYNILSYNPFKKRQVFVSDTAGIKIVEENRNGLHIQQYSIDEKKKKLERDNGYKFFFGFLHTR